MRGVWCRNLGVSPVSVGQVKYTLLQFVNLWALLIFFLVPQFVSDGISCLRVSMYDGMDERTLRLELTPQQLVVAIGFDPELDATAIRRDRSGRLDVEWLENQLGLIEHFRGGVSRVALFVGDDVPLDDVIRVIDTCAGAGLAVSIDPCAAPPFAQPDRVGRHPCKVARTL